jgi:fructokinase
LGCAILLRDQYVEVRGYRVHVVDTVGAGDAFSAAFLHGLDAGWPVAQIGDFANRLGALVASRPGGAAPWSLDQIEALSRSI